MTSRLARTRVNRWLPSETGFVLSAKPVPMARIVLLAILLILVPASYGADEPVRGKIDRDIGSGLKKTYPVFVRMTDQLLGGSGDYERFCKEHATAKRRELRPTILQALRTKADRSWKQVAERVAQLEKSRGVQNLDRYWIINGFTCDATGDACRRMAAMEEISFVYLQRGRLHQVKRERDPGQVVATPQQESAFRRVLADWKDDSDEPFTTEGLHIPWNLQAIQADAVWKEEKVTGRGIVVALNDSGLMITPALTHALWKNPGEVFNGKDDDGDGYVDDVFGYDFHNESYWSIGDDLKWPHGSMCAGTIAGRPINRMSLLTGVAPRARLMVLRGMGYLKSYEYALIHGADVLSMSYMWDDVEFANFRGVYRTAHGAPVGRRHRRGRRVGQFLRSRRGNRSPCPRTSPA